MARLDRTSLAGFVFAQGEKDRVALGHQLLDRDRAFDSCDNRGKHQQHAVAHRLDETAA
jgi:hypothetical protein